MAFFDGFLNAPPPPPLPAHSLPPLYLFKWKMLRWYITGPSFIYMGHVILEFWSFKSSLSSRKYHFSELVLVRSTSGMGVSPTSSTPPLRVSFQQLSQMVYNDSKKTPTFVAFFKLLLGRLKAHIILISWHFLMVSWMAAPPSTPTSRFTATPISVRMKDIEVVDSWSKLHLHVTCNSAVLIFQ